MEITVDLYSSKGIIECKLKRFSDRGKEYVYADLWQSEAYKDGGITKFRAAVPMWWDGLKYIIADKNFKDYNAFWKEMEILISNMIVVNE